MRSTRLLLACACGLALALALLVALTPAHSEKAFAAPAAAIRYVLDDGGVDAGNCTDQNNPCKTVQYALGQASSGDTIRVANKYSPAVYTGTVVITKSVTLEGGWGAIGSGSGLIWQRPTPCQASWTTIDAQGAGRVISITGNITPTIDCFTITGGDASGLGGDPRTTSENDAGGGIYSRDAAPIIINNVITANTAWTTHTVAYARSNSVLGGGECGRGGGIYLLNAPATTIISGNLVANNIADKSSCGHGGGIALRDSDAQVLDNIIERNRAGDSVGWGGGIATEGGEPTIAENEILYNTGAGTTYGCGGGISVYSSPLTTIERNYLQGNKVLSSTGSAGLTAQGGGMCIQSGPIASVATIRDNVLRYNTAAPHWLGEGGGMYLSGLVTPSLVSGNTLQENVGGFNVNGSGGGIYVDDSEVTISDNHIFENAATWSGDYGVGGGIRVNGGAVLIQGNVITSNYAAFFPGSPAAAEGYGGGVAILGGQTTVQGNQIVGNRGTNSEDLGMGGGIYGESGTLEIVGNTIAENRASAGNHGFGGGLYLEQTDPWVESNTILDNEAAAGTFGQGGGVCLSACPIFTLTNNIVARNDASMWGSGIAITYSDGQLVHNTIAENLAGDGIGVRVDYAGSDVVLYNNIIVSQTVGISNTNPSSTVTAEYTLFEGNGTDYGAGVTSTHEVPGPAALLADYHLGSGSNAINTAATLSWVTNDIDGDLRPYGSSSDVGADEFACLARVGTTDYIAIQDAINAAASGQTVYVAEGTCHENLRITKTVTLEGGWDVAFSSRYADPALVSTINGMGTGRVISITEVSGSIAPTIDGFTITDGDATGLAGSGAYGYDIGGGIYGWYADVTVANCVITDNVAGTDDIAWGGGIGFYGGNITLQDSVVAGNVASTASNGYGGGAFFRYGTATVSGNTVEDNVASEMWLGQGGGLHFFFGSATLQGNTVRGNVASRQGTGYGGGICLYGHTVSMDGDVVEGNDANVPGNEGYGGGISAVYNSTLTMDGVVIRDNVAHSDPPGLVFGQGGGVYVDDSALTLSNSTVASNTAYSGGGAYLYAGDNAILNDNFFTNNDAIAYGGGVYVQNSQAVAFTANLFTGNSVVGNGGGSYILFSDDITLNANTIISNADTGVSFYGCEDALMDNNVIADNEGGVSITGHTTRLRHNTIARNGALGVSVWGYWDGDGTAILTNTILVSHTVGITVTSGNTATLEGTLWGDGAWANETNWGGDGFYDHGEIIVIGDPAFVDPDQGDYHVGPGSDAIDQGLDVGVTTDIDGDSRPIGDLPDIGADEAWRWVFLPLVLRNSSVKMPS